MALKDADISLQIIEGKPAYMDVVGMTYEDLSANAVDLDPCANGEDVNTFSESDVTMSSPTPFTFKKTAQAELGVQSSVDVKAALQASGVPAEQLDMLQADFKAAYASKAASEFSMSGTYQRIALKNAVTGAIKNKSTANSDAKACGDVLRSSDKALIYSIAVIKLDAAKYVSNVIDNLSVSFAAAVKAKAGSADIVKLKSELKKEINSSLMVVPGPDWRVISWDYVQLDS
ncbi:hypothetical protein [Sphingobium sp. Z007]|uniref:hypothetical protein n=1 Tax=Sphingobium sp. Z007 TaxID=627495 RepID=UPI001124CC98|nr:hypothetical protein [Sphingobium sp. Z007]